MFLRKKIEKFSICKIQGALFLLVYIQKQKKKTLAYTLAYFSYEVIAKIPSLIQLSALH